MKESDIDEFIRKGLHYKSKDMNKYGKICSWRDGYGDKFIEVNPELLIKYIKDLKARNRKELIETVIGWMLVFTQAYEDVVDLSQKTKASGLTYSIINK